MERTPKNFRREHLAVRNAMSEEEVQEKSGHIVEWLLASDWYPDAKEIFVYFPLGNEADCRKFMEQAWQDGKRIALPRTREGFQMDFFYVDSFRQLAEGAFHVKEPVDGCIPAIPEKQPVIVPGSVFGRNGARYGYGKGYYDRFFASHPYLKRYAVCYENQLEDMLEAGFYDVPMHRIYTECGVIECGSALIQEF